MKRNLVNKKSVFQKVKRWLLILALVFITLVIAFSLIFIFNKDKISSRLLLSVNNLIQGEIIFDDISLNPFVQFPQTSISLNNLMLYGSANHITDSSIQPILDIEYLYAAINIRELIKGNIVVSNILADNGKINIVINPDSTVNILNAVKRNDSIAANAYVGKTEKNKNIFTDTVKGQNFALSLEGIGFENIGVYIIDKNTNKSSKFTINSLASDLEFSSDSLSVKLKTETIINELDALEKIFTDDIIFKIDGNFNVNLIKKIVYLDYAKLDINSALFKISGISHFGFNKKVDIAFEGSNIDLVFLKFFLNKSGFENLKKGEIYLNGKIKGNFLGKIPITKCWFGISNMELDIPGTKQSISNLNFNGFFNSGSNTDFSEAILRIDTLAALLPNGYAHGKLLLKNFKKPQLKYLVDIKTDITGLQSVFNIKKIDSLKGAVEVHSEFSGKFNKKMALKNKTISNTSIIFESVSFIVNTNMKYIEIDGQLSGNIDTLCISNLSTLIGNSDFFINGMAYNISTLIFPNANNFTSQLNISSNLFDLVDFMNYRENIGIGFPYQATGLELDVTAQTNKKRLLNSSPVPDITFNINQLDVTVNKMLPPVLLSNGTFVLGGNNGDLFLTFNNFDVVTTGGSLKADVVYHEPFNDKPYVDIKSQIIDFNPLEFFAHKSDTDTIKNALLNGKANCKLLFNDNKKVMFSNIEFNANELSFKTDSASYKAKELSIKTDKVSYNTKVSKNPLVTLSTNIAISAASVTTKKAELDSMAFLVNANNGGYKIGLNNIEIFDGEGNGSLFIAPYAKPAVVKIDLDITNLDANKLLQSFVKDTLIEGKANLLFELSGSGNSLNKVLASLNGDVSLTSNNLLFYGIDLDNLLLKVERSQHFNLVDLGAVMVAGPIGLLFSKGSTYTNILLTDRYSTTNITPFVFNWEVKNGTFSIRDVAFCTKENRIAAKGWLNITTDSLDVAFAVINAKGCSKLSQRVGGSLKKPNMGELIILSTLIAPVTNLFKVESNCKPFYTGSVKHPKIDIE